MVACSANEHSLEGDFQMVTNDLLNCNGADEEEEGMETDERWTCKRRVVLADQLQPQSKSDY